ncbi:hypothetical protein HF888_11485 [Bermanella marisrubri]|uniref:Uncharacterized protein n=1 Tax=Bermanella marisrubri TaxID=207949 RepID=Q1N151_9GAMM|nr:hypothetical protein [Bermanella marisrubri]EAT12000.1 hypothetical protein RED65_11685 [Oceanobacter sp. RED65] [Bermanella marisrubri]QIZ84804.1 hypothetical protein HF888_11485 [Bermanella marisrubri]
MKLLSLSLAVLISLSASFVVAEEKKDVDLKAKIDGVQQQLDELIDQGGKYAYIQIARKNGLSPFAIAVDKVGSTVLLEVPQSEKDATIKDKVLELRRLLKMTADSGTMKAGALFVQGQVPHKGKTVNGVAIELEHELGMSVLRFSPYEIDRENKKIQFKQPVDKIKPVVFFKDVQEKQKNKNS